MFDECLQAAPEVLNRQGPWATMKELTLVFS